MLATIEQLQQLWILRTLSEENLSQLQPHAEIRTFQKEEMVMIEEDELPACLFALVEGKLQIQKTATTGKETVVRMIHAGEMFAAPAMFGNQIAPATVVCQEKSVVVMIDKNAIIDAIQETPEIALQILATFNQRLQHLHETVHGLISERATVRLARLILYQAKEYGTRQEKEGEILNVKLPYYQMARMVGITYEECTRLLKKMETAVSYRRGGTILIHDWELMAAFTHAEEE
ncbi:transcriptional regulator, Crp/Fnr family [Halothece sp. PCC 7418]|uniref:Crp/Fnr family transcriptional regulator n=1 Tax=Halothece sp. (strain PCC 7418) TaxID=65093 RepID=UPI0002A08584|nr:Crp/Fnr family transcriptional regulator [Halothece sp. PCC 7418]AFZ44186.1 transcriptional regulator, Crp/Fnr family [Halothece sp. PCC 7418]